ncbi:uncharacterized protein [Primulina eburnea]|uniref:uncharacterized protein n=1 Tax=Primulina eburnea TaxID=1245227 RepID=UPI003C6C815E
MEEAQFPLSAFWGLPGMKFELISIDIIRDELSLPAARADNFYYPRNGIPKKGLRCLLIYGVVIVSHDCKRCAVQCERKTSGNIIYKEDMELSMTVCCCRHEIVIHRSTSCEYGLIGSSKKIGGYDAEGMLKLWCCQVEDDAMHSDDYSLNQTTASQLRIKERVVEKSLVLGNTGFGLRLSFVLKEDAAAASRCKFATKFEKIEKHKGH